MFKRRPIHHHCILVGVIRLITVCAETRVGAQCVCRDIDVVNKPILTIESRHLFTDIDRLDNLQRL